MSLADIKEDLERNVVEVRDAHHIHAWSITGERHMVTLHVHPAPGFRQAVVMAVQQRLAALPISNT
jgi:cobalt-zinc-cadmium efflux system protein